MQLQLTVSKQQSISTILAEIAATINQAKDLLDFPLASIAECLIAIGEFIIGEPEYETLHDQLSRLVSEREGEIASSRFSLQRGITLLEADRPIDSIRAFGKALNGLTKHESRHDLCRALYYCACAYERIGLLWAARGTLLAAASVSFSDYWKYEEITPFQAACIRRLKWVDLQLGRIPQTLSWHQLDSIVRSVLVDQGYDRQQLQQGDVEFDAVTALMMLRIEMSALKNLVRFPDVLSSLDLPHAASAILYVLGHPPILQFDDDESKQESIVHHFVSLRDSPAAFELQQSPEFGSGTTIHAASNIAGCVFSIESPNESPGIEFLESVLAAIEGTLATAISRHLFSRQASFKISIHLSDFADSPMQCKLDESDGFHHLVITCAKFNPDTLNHASQKEVREQLHALLVTVITNVLVPDVDQIHSLLKDDLALARAVGFTGSFVTTGNILGSNRRFNVDDWMANNCDTYDLQRNRPWDKDHPKPEASKTQFKVPNESQYLDHTHGAPDFQKTKHNQVRTLRLIREALWNKAGWQGIGVVVRPDFPPIFAIGFKNRDPAIAIFKTWENELGKRDIAERLRVCVIRGINRQRVHHYRVVISENIEQVDFAADTAAFMMPIRIHTMEPTRSNNLDGFLECYALYKCYFLAPALITESSPYPEQLGDCGIFKHQLIVKHAWEIGPSDIDRVGILPGDDPVIPSNVSSPPIHELLKQKAPIVQNSPRPKDDSQKNRREQRKNQRQQKKRSRRK